MMESNVLLLGETALADCQFRAGPYLAETSEREITSVLSGGSPGSASACNSGVTISNPA